MYYRQTLAERYPYPNREDVPVQKEKKKVQRKSKPDSDSEDEPIKKEKKAVQRSAAPPVKPAPRYVCVYVYTHMYTRALSPSHIHAHTSTLGRIEAWIRGAVLGR